MKKTLGGERLGSGNKMQVDLHGFERSTHDLSYIWRSTMSAGTLVPFLKEVALPGDTFDIKLNCDIKTHPTIGPLFGSYKVQLDVFQVPMRLYHSALHNNRLGIGMNMSQIKLPKIELLGNPVSATHPDPDNAQVNSSCIISYLGIRGVGAVGSGATEGLERKFNAVPFLAYWDIYKNYYANKQEEIGYVIHNTNPTFVQTVDTVSIDGTDVTNGVTIDGTYPPIQITYTGSAPDPKSVYIEFADGKAISVYELVVDNFISLVSPGVLEGTYNFSKWGNRSAWNWRYATPGEWGNTRPELYEFPLEDIDKMRDEILQKAWNAEFVVNVDAAAIEPYNLVLDRYLQNGQTMPYTTLNQEGLGIKTYQSDLFNNWLSTEWIDGTGGINEITAVDTSGGSFNIDALQLSKKVYDMLNRIAVSGGSYNDWLEAVYDHESFNRAESPVYVGGLIKELAFQEVVSNAAATESDVQQPLGTLAGRGVLTGKHKGGTVVVKTDEPSYILGIISLTPRIDYSQGNKWDVNLDTLDDLHKPSLDAIGFQELITEQMAYWTTKMNLSLQWEQRSAGKQPAWINYMTNVNEVRGNFAVRDNEMFMTLNRRYEAEDIGDGNMDIKDLTTYIDPAKFNHIFAQTSLDAQNFWAQISIDMTARRKMSAKVMPNL